MDIVEIKNFLQETAPFSYLHDSVLSRALKSLNVFYAAAQTKVNLTGQRLLIVRSGEFTLINSQNGAQFQLLEGDCYGYRELLPAELKLTSTDLPAEHLVCEQDGLIYWLPAEVFQRCYAESAHFAGYFEGLSRRNLHQYQDPQAGTPLTIKIGDIIPPQKVVTTPERSVADAAKLMSEKRVSSLLVEQDEKLVGILTDRDLRNRVVARALPPTQSVGTIMTPSPHTIDKKAFLFEAMQLMSRYNIHHLPVTDGPKTYGMITLTDVVRTQQNHPVYLIGDLHRQKDLKGLQQCMRQLTPMLKGLAAQQVAAQEISQIIATVTDALTQQLLRLGEERLGPAPCLYCWLAFGSQARGEQSINSDQDNALLISQDIQGQGTRYFRDLSQWVCEGLSACGIALCPGNIMASNPDLRLSLGDWQKKFFRLIRTPDPQSILQSSIFFDMRCIYGHQALAEQLQNTIIEHTKNNQLFLFHMARAALERKPPLGMVRQFITEEDSHGNIGIDSKKRGISLVTDIVRVYALAYGIKTVNTRERLKVLSHQRRLTAQEAENLLAALNVITQLRWQTHFQQLTDQIPHTNLINPESLHVLQRHQLKDSFNVINKAQAALKSRFCPSL